MHVHVSALNVVINALGVIMVLFLLNWIAMKYKDNSNFWASWANLASAGATD